MQLSHADAVNISSHFHVLQHMITYCVRIVCHGRCHVIIRHQMGLCMSLDVVLLRIVVYDVAMDFLWSAHVVSPQSLQTIYPKAIFVAWIF